MAPARTRDEMVAARKVQNQYQSDVTGYLKCLKDEHEATLAKVDPAAKNAEDEKKKLTSRWEKKNDAAVDEAQDVADRFNEQLSAYNKAKAAKGKPVHGLIATLRGGAC